MRKATLLLTATLLATASSQSCGSGFTLVGSACYLFPDDSLTWIIAQEAEGEIDQTEIRDIKRKISEERQQAQKDELDRLTQHLSTEMGRKIHTAQEAGASNWLTSLPIRAKGFSLNKQEFVDAIALRYGWPIEGLPDLCACGSPNDVTHTMTCKKGGFVCIRHDEVRDLTASMLGEVCQDVTTEPALLPLDGEHLRYRTANTSQEARVDVSARGFWVRGQRAFMDIRIFDPMAACHRELPLQAAHHRNEQEKTRAYGERIQHVDQGSFTPLVFTTSGGMGPRAQCFYTRLAELISEKKQQPRSHVVAWMRCRLSFSLLRQQARNYCRALVLPDGKKASLARVESCSQLHALTNHITNQGYEIADYWLGGTSALDVTGAFRWESTGALVPIGPPFWFPGQPDYAGIERTLSLSKTGLFADEGESLEQKFICQIL